MLIPVGPTVPNITVAGSTQAKSQCTSRYKYEPTDASFPFPGPAP
jgi:hypothetical protein